MNDIKALLTRLVQNPDLVKSLKDPQALGQLAGLGEDKLKALAGVGNVLSGFLGGRRKSPVPKAHTPRDAGSSGSGSSGGARNTALAGTVSLTAIAGAVAALGTVSVVALSKGRKVSQS
jgi:hypothetical protein